MATGSSLSQVGISISMVLVFVPQKPAHLSEVSRFFICLGCLGAHAGCWHWVSLDEELPCCVVEPSGSQVGLKLRPLAVAELAQMTSFLLMQQPLMLNTKSSP